LALKEYKYGILPQDHDQLVRYIEACRTQYTQRKNVLDWEREMLKRDLRTPSNVRAAELSTQQAQITLQEAETMLLTLTKFTAPKLITNLEAKVEAVRADLLAQESSFQREDERKRRLEKNIANCILRAPCDGIVVYSMPANSWGRTEVMIREGATVREGQSIFNVPDPKRMRVRARINETKIASIQPGLDALVKIDAFPDLTFPAKVAEVTAIPAPANGPFSDVKIYFAMVDIESGAFDKLRPGLSAEVAFRNETKHDVTRIPVSCIRWLNGSTYAAVPSGDNSFAWRPITLGLIDPSYAEVVKGLEPGDTIIADVSELPAPRSKLGVDTPPSVPSVPSPSQSAGELSENQSPPTVTARTQG
jgi:multidrug efflux pump subunit AcrA (membrane-fusion protein)